MKTFLKYYYFLLHIIFYPLIYLFKKLPFATRRKIYFKTTGFMGFIGKSFIIFQHVFSYEKGSKERLGNSGLIYIVLAFVFGLCYLGLYCKV